MSDQQEPTAIRGPKAVSMMGKNGMDKPKMLAATERTEGRVRLELNGTDGKRITMIYGTPQEIVAFLHALLEAAKKLLTKE